MAFIKHRPGAVLAILTLIVIGLFFVVLRTVWIKKGGGSDHDRVWQLTCNFQFHANGADTIAYVALPVETAGIKLLSQKFVYPGMRQVRLKERTGKVREAVFQATHQGPIQLKAEFQVHTRQTEQLGKETTKENLSADDRELYLQSGPQIQVESRLVTALYEKHFAEEIDKNRQIELIADYCENKILTISDDGSPDAAGVLTRRKASSIGRARAMVALFRLAKVPARLITGFILAERPVARPHYWVEIYQDKQWRPFDPEDGYRYELPFNYLPVRRGGPEILRLKEGANPISDYGITQTSSTVLTHRSEKNITEILNLSRLPVGAQSALVILLMLPLGALITTFFRNIVGIRTFGTFTPTLLALATVYADWRTATIIFLIVIVVGIAGRSLMPGFKLMKIPRLSIVFTLVAITMAVTISFLEYLHFTPAGHVVLLPLVVLTTIIDRVYSISDEDGVRIALQRLGWTIAVALVCFLLFQWQALGRLLLVYPELHFITLALLLLLGLYNQKKLSDFAYFRFLTENKKTKPKAVKDE